jgi:MoaA/NifB/PqqE/SkfB family radical SAM enzyme
MVLIVTHDFLRGRKGSFKRATNAIKELVSIRRKLKKEKPVLSMRSVINSRNIDKLPQMTLLAISLGVDLFTPVLMDYSHGNYSLIKKAKLELTSQQVSRFPKIWKEVEEIAKRYDFQVGTELKEKLTLKEEKSKDGKFLSNFSQATTHRFSPICLEPFLVLSINGIGNVSPCSRFIPTRENIAGSSLKEIWYGNFFSSFRKKMIEGKLPMNTCKICMKAKKE